MKRALLLFVAGLAFISCARQIDGTITIGETAEVTFRAIQENGRHSGTKTSVDNDGTVYWSPKENINIFFDSNSSKFTSTNTVKSDVVDFEGYPVEGVYDLIMGLYPYDGSATVNVSDGIITTTFSNQQVATANSFQEGRFPTVAKAKPGSKDLYFYNICGGIKFSVGNTGIKKIIVKGNNGEAIAGKINVRFADSGKPEVVGVTEGQTEIILTSEDGLAVGTVYYIPVLPTKFTNGLTVRLETEGMYAEAVYGGAREIKRSVWANLGQVDDGEEWKWIPWDKQPFTVTSKGNTSISFRYVSMDYPTFDLHLQYRKISADEWPVYGAWTNYYYNTSIELTDGEMLQFKGNNDRFHSGETDMESYYFKGSVYGPASSPERLKLSGNIMSLLNSELKSDYMAPSAFTNLFKSNPLIEDVSELVFPPITSSYCYDSMFSYCDNLVKGPTLPAATLSDRCYWHMFQHCESLNYLKALFTTTPSSNYTNNWLEGVASTGTFVKSKDASWDVRGSSGIPDGWTVQTE